MGKEIERKFLVKDSSYKDLAIESFELRQGYLSRNPDATVRVRISGDKAWLTVKSRNKGAERGEWEYCIPASDASEMFALCEGTIEKRRWIVDAGSGLRWEVDEFEGRHKGLVVAEIELPTEDTSFTLPSFVGEEVTGDPRYYNSVLAN